MRDSTDAIQRLLDESEIRRLVYRYCRAIDRCQFEDLRECYHPEATDHHGDFFGTRDEFVAHVAEALPRYASSTHFVGNLLIELDGDSARVESYCLALLRTAPDGRAPRDNLVAVRYLDHVVKRAGEWRILHRKCVYDFTRTDEVAPGWEFSEFFLRGRRDREDAVYAPSLGDPPAVPTAPVTREF